MKHLARVLAVLLLALFAAGSAWANSVVTLGELFNGGSITVGDKLFDSWEPIFYDSSDPTRGFNAGNLTVAPLDDGGDYGLRFTVANSELTVTGDDVYAYTDLSFGFRVSVLDPMYLISDNTLTFVDMGAMLIHQEDGSNDLGVYIRESIGAAAGLDDLGVKDIQLSVLDDVITRDYPATSAFAPQQQIWVTKNILVWSVDSTDSAALYGFDQRFSQTPVPEPSTFLLLGAGLAGLAVWRKKRS